MFHRAVLLGLITFGFGAGCDDDPAGPAPTRRVALSISANSIATVSDRFVSFAVDTAQVAGAEFWDPNGGFEPTEVPAYDFTRTKLRTLTAALSPAYLRIGGTDADWTYYAIDDPSATAPANYKWVITKSAWDAVADFATDLDLKILFTLNAGPGPRDSTGHWTDDNARELVRYSQAQGYPVDVWELGNEVNGYGLLLGINITPQIYTADLMTAKTMLQSEAPGSKLAGPSSAFWPVAGDFIGFMEDFMPVGGGLLDIVTWHYYPQQSIRCPVATRRAGPEVLFEDDALADVETWAGLVDQLTASHANGAEIWLGETGNAQCGGQPGVSDTFLGSFWWADQLGRLAKRGHRVAIRQTLSGSDYGLLDDLTLDPRPDYWLSVLWKRLVGSRVFDVTPDIADPQLRVYAHCSTEPGKLALIVLNLHASEPVRVSSSDLAMEQSYVLTGANENKDVLLGSQTLALSADDSLPELKPQSIGNIGHVDLPARSITLLIGASKQCN